MKQWCGGKESTEYRILITELLVMETGLLLIKNVWHFCKSFRQETKMAAWDSWCLLQLSVLTVLLTVNSAYVLRFLESWANTAE